MCVENRRPRRCKKNCEQAEEKFAVLHEISISFSFVRILIKKNCFYFLHLHISWLVVVVVVVVVLIVWLSVDFLEQLCEIENSNLRPVKRRTYFLGSKR